MDLWTELKTKQNKTKQNSEDKKNGSINKTSLEQICHVHTVKLPAESDLYWHVVLANLLAYSLLF